MPVPVAAYALPLPAALLIAGALTGGKLRPSSVPLCPAVAPVPAAALYFSLMAAPPIAIAVPARPLGLSSVPQPSTRCPRPGAVAQIPAVSLRLPSVPSRPSSLHTPRPWRLSSVPATRCRNTGPGGGPMPCRSLPLHQSPLPVPRDPCTLPRYCSAAAAAPIPAMPQCPRSLPARRSPLPSLWSCCVLRRHPFRPVSQNGHGSYAVTLPPHCPPHTSPFSSSRDRGTLPLHHPPGAPGTTAVQPPHACVLAHSAPAPTVEPSEAASGQVPYFLRNFDGAPGKSPASHSPFPSRFSRSGSRAGPWPTGRRCLTAAAAPRCRKIAPG